MATQTNGMAMKITIGAVITLLLFTLGSVWRAAGYASSIDANHKEVMAMKPIVHANEISIELFRQDIKRIVTAQEKMTVKNEENTKRILEAIRDGN